MSVPYSSRKALSVNGLTNATIAPTPTDDDVLTYKSASNSWVNQAVGSAATTIDVVDNTIDASFKPTYIAGVAGTNKTLNCSNTNWTINPGTGEFLFLPTIKVGGDVANGRVAVGANSGTNSAQDTTSCGHNAGNVDQNLNACAFGLNAGLERQSANACAFGPNCAVDRQGRSSCAFGNGAAGVAPQPDNQICINASGIAFTGTQSQACYINPIARRDNGSGVGNMTYNPTTFEITYSGT
tara:strand:- start:2590 stop:3309 length:720 start_codon:yes stop_codon:yes gene_type:complete